MLSAQKRDNLPRHAILLGMTIFFHVLLFSPTWAVRWFPISRVPVGLALVLFRRVKRQARLRKTARSWPQISQSLGTWNRALGTSDLTGGLCLPCRDIRGARCACKI
jgi:hypothetical protein